ncbi:calcium-translocating P-type ATPase, PMCA-type [Cyphellophora europaea CBS 101466]|uniref:Calcium-transporting ATPase n=1 Tax=Cyphellophora europaea (strain CBS 101466) TaxID=1220924 RepID=W2S3Q8_CYPE1|nr:calcium-translocating P-type ATPase, PMCA-type [Cyphellophora europaea CBS 101466]ETN43336.1 calcium-translocating P-type ATPase, PMCA-type [Cyphellophora europaea CBS 101466]
MVEDHLATLPKLTTQPPSPSPSRRSNTAEGSNHDQLRVSNELPSAAPSIGGETLHSRDGSLGFNPRTRTNTDATAVTISPIMEKEKANAAVSQVKDIGSDSDSISTEGALRPDKGAEKDFVVDNNPFGVSPGELNKMQNPKSLAAFKALGGLPGIERALRTDVNAGLSVDEARLSGSVPRAAETALSEKNVATKVNPAAAAGSPNDIVTAHQVQDQFIDRRRVFKDNRLPARKTYTLGSLLWAAYNDKILWLLTVAAVVSLALGLYETFDSGSQVDWVEGLAICIAIIIIVLVTAFNDWQKEKQFTKLNQKKEDREVKCVRSGKALMISVYDVLVGDVLHLEPGDSIPADGIFIQGHGVKCDESSATGESDALKKTGGMEVWHQLCAGGPNVKKLDPFLISGSKVLEGVGTFLVTSTGVNSSYGKIMMSLRVKTEPTPLQVKLGRMANWIGGLGSIAAGILFLIQLFRFVARLDQNDGTPSEKAGEFLDILITAITIIVMAVPEGLPLAVTLALAFATTHMMKENNLVRVLRACETMGNATTICSDKTGTLTQNKMTVVAGSWSIGQKFSTSGEDGASTFASVFGRLSAPFKALLDQSIVVNSTAFEGEEEGQKTFIGSKTEVAMLQLAEAHLGLTSTAQVRANNDIVQLYPFDSARKCMGSVIRLPNGSYRLVVKGAAEIMLGKADWVISNTAGGNLDVTSLDVSTKEAVGQQIQSYASRSLRTIGFLYKDYPSWPPTGARSLEGDKSAAEFADVFYGMTWVGLVGIQDPLRPQVTMAVQRCQQAGIKVRMVTGDNLTTATAIATECGIRTADGVVMEGPVFRQLSESEMAAVVPKLDVLARSSPEDKRILVAHLKKQGETVAVTGDGTNDGPALKTADVGFSMGIAGTEVAKEASEIILMDDNFASIVKAVMWGRSVNDAVAKFLQFQITVNIAAVTLAFISAVSSTENRSVLSAVQLLWINLVMDTFAALALATDAPTDAILDRPPTPKSASLISTHMWKMIMGHALYQVVVSLVLFFAGAKIFNYRFISENHHRQEELNTMVFNAFTWMQFFNMFNARRLDNHFNIFENVHKNPFFMAMAAVMAGGQVMIIFVGGKAFEVVPLDGPQWATSIMTALPVLLWGVLLRCVPDEVSGRFLGLFVTAFKLVFGPVGRCFGAMFAPVGRAWRRMRGNKLERRMSARGADAA